eukprot:4282158-Amphidinium_carterae.1
MSFAAAYSLNDFRLCALDSHAVSAYKEYVNEGDKRPEVFDSVQMLQNRAMNEATCTHRISQASQAGCQQQGVARMGCLPEWPEHQLVLSRVSCMLSAQMSVNTAERWLYEKILIPTLIRRQSEL